MMEEGDVVVSHPHDLLVDGEGEDQLRTDHHHFGGQAFEQTTYPFSS